MDLGRAVNEFGPSTSEAETATTEVGFPNSEHTAIEGSKRGNRDRAPKALTLRQSVQDHLSLDGPLQASRPLAGPGPDPRHGRPSLLERISRMEEVPHNQTVSAVHQGVSAGPDPTRSLRSTAVQPGQSGTVDNNTKPADEHTVNIGSNRADAISDLICQDNPTAQAERPDRAPRVNTNDILERTRIRLAKVKNVMVAGIPPTAPTPPPMPLDCPTPAGPGETTPPAPVVAALRNKLLERLEGERKRAIGAASGGLEVEPVGGNISEGSLKAELRARNQLRARLAAVKVDYHVGNLEP